MFVFSLGIHIFEISFSGGKSLRSWSRSRSERKIRASEKIGWKQPKWEVRGGIAEEYHTMWKLFEIINLATIAKSGSFSGSGFIASFVGKPAASISIRAPWCMPGLPGWTRSGTRLSEQQTLSLTSALHEECVAVFYKCGFIGGQSQPQEGAGGAHGCTHPTALPLELLKQGNAQWAMPCQIGNGLLPAKREECRPVRWADDQFQWPRKLATLTTKTNNDH